MTEWFWEFAWPFAPAVAAIGVWIAIARAVRGGEGTT